MKQELEQKLYAIDPVFFREKDMDMTQTCMCWGIECGDGWYEPITKFLEKVKMLNQLLVPVNKCIVASQIKSKWADFTCYWNIDVLDEDNDQGLGEKEEELVSTVYGMMEDTVNGCVEECSHTCEICGKHSIWNDEVFVCGSWLTVKCLECAQKKQREEGRITNFRDGFMFLSPFVEEPIIIEGKCYHTIIGAYYGTLYPEHEGMFLEMKSPSEVQGVAMNMGLCRDDEYAFQTMKKVLRIRYAEGKQRERLIGTKGLDITQLNYSHENRWGSCWCKNCEGKGENHYGKILMEIRDEILKEEESK